MKKSSNLFGGSELPLIPRPNAPRALEVGFSSAEPVGGQGYRVAAVTWMERRISFSFSGRAACISKNFPIASPAHDM
jgi:hypothetical protein